jgi:hypothetical protein
MLECFLRSRRDSRQYVSYSLTAVVRVARMARRVGVDIHTVDRVCSLKKEIAREWPGIYYSVLLHRYDMQMY